MCQGRDGHELSSLTGRGRNSRDTAFERCDALFEDHDGRVLDTAVDVAKLLEPEKAGAMAAVVEGETCSCVYGHCSGVCGLVWFVTVHSLLVPE